MATPTLNLNPRTGLPFGRNRLRREFRSQVGPQKASNFAEFMQAHPALQSAFQGGPAGNFFGLTFGAPTSPLPSSVTVPPASSPVGGVSPRPEPTRFTPDFDAILRNDPIFSQQRADLSAQGISDAAQRAAATQRALVQFGVVPDFEEAGGNLGLSDQQLSFLRQDVTPEVRELARESTEEGLSVTGRIREQNERNIRQIRNALAARGMLRSGELGFQLGEAQQAFKRAQFGARNELLDYLGGVQAAYVEAERMRQRQLAEAARAVPVPEPSPVSGPVTSPVQEPAPTPTPTYGPQDPTEGPSATVGVDVRRKLLRQHIRSMREAGMGWPAIKATDAWVTFRALGGS